MPILLLVFSWFDWQVLKTENFTVIYPPGYEWAAQQAILNLEKYRTRVNDLTDNRARNTPIVIEDVGTTSNGFANPLFYNIHVFTSPPGFGSALEGIENWYRVVAVHEYTHIGHMTKTTGVPRILTAIFGAPFQSNMYSPGWIIEGITVFSESQITPYEGRLNDGVFDSYIGTRVGEDKFPSIIEATNEPLIFPNGKIYLYGGEFFDFLSSRYGKERFRQFFNCYGSYPWAPISAILPCAGLDLASHHVYGKTFPALFGEWRRHEEARFAAWHEPGQQVTHDGWYAYALVYHADKLYYVREMPLKLSAFNYRNITQIVELDPATGNQHVVKSLASFITAPIRIKDNDLYYAAAQFRKAPNQYYEGFGITSALYKLNLSSHKETFLFTDDIRGFGILPGDTIVYAKDQTGCYGSEIWFYHQGKLQKKFTTDHSVNEIAIDSGSIVVTARKNNENWDIYRIAGSELIPVINTPWVEGAVSVKQGIISFTANYEKMHSCYLYDLDDSTLYRLTDNGYASCGEIVADTLFFIGLNGKGYDICKKELEALEYDLPAFSPAEPGQDPVLHVARGNYSDILKTLLPAWRQPFLFPADTTFEKWIYGALLLGGDATNENIYALAFAYDQLAEKPIANITYNSYFFSPLQLTVLYDYDDFLTLDTYLPLFRNLGPGLSSVALSIDGRSFDEFTRKEITTALSFACRFPLTDLSFVFYCPTEKKAWRSAIDRTAYAARLRCGQIAFSGQFVLNVHGYTDAENPETPSFRIRGYDAIPSKHALVLTAEYNHHLFDIRYGLWNPNVYFEGLSGGLFVDGAVSDNGGLDYSAGVKIELETKVAFGFIQLAPQVGIALTEDKKFKLFFNIFPGISL